MLPCVLLPFRAQAHWHLQPGRVGRQVLGEKRLACGSRERQEGMCRDNSPEGQGGDWSEERPTLSGLLTLTLH